MARIWPRLFLTVLLLGSLGGIVSTRPASAAAWCECVIYILNRFNSGAPLSNPDGRYNYAYQLDRPDPDGRIWMELIAGGSFRRTSEPRAGGVIVLQRGVAGASTIAGHIGVIESVSDQGGSWRITLRSSNWSGSTFTDANCTNVTSAPLSISKGETGVSYWAQGATPTQPPTTTVTGPTTQPPTAVPPQACPAITPLGPKAGQTFGHLSVTFTWQLPGGDCAGAPVVLRVKRVPGMNDPGNDVLNIVLPAGSVSYTASFSPDVNGATLYWAAWHERSGTGPGAVESFRVVLPDLPTGNTCSAPLYRYVNAQKQRHVNSTNPAELGQGRDGWVYEGFEGYLATGPSCAPDLVSFIRLYHPSRNKHFLTGDPAEVELAKRIGFVVEGSIGYIMIGPGLAGAQPLYRLYRDTSDDHFYTASKAEADLAASQFGYRHEGVAGYVFPSLILPPTATPVPPTATPVPPTATPVPPTTTDNLWATTGALLIDPSQPRAGGPVLLSLRVERSGGKSPLGNVCARFYLGDPASGGQAIGDGCIPLLAPRSSASTAAVPWVPLIPGPAMIYAVIDPDGAISESLEDDNVISATVTVAAPRADALAPRVDTAAIVGGTDTSSRAVRVTAEASDPAPGSGVAALLLVEYRYQSDGERWVPERISPWLPYQGASGQYSFELSATPGMRYIQVWARDYAANVSVRPYQLLLSYVAPIDRVESGATRIYRYELRAGDRLSVRVVPVGGGDPDLYIWPPDHERGRPPWVSNLGEGADSVSLTAPVAGVYQVEVVGYVGGEYQLLVDTGPALQSGEEGEAEHLDVLKALRAVPALPLTSAPDQSAPPRHTTYLPQLSS